MYIYWLPTDIEKVRTDYFTTDATAKLGRFSHEKPISDPVVIDPLKGGVFKPEKVTKDEFEIIIKDLPLAEYPLIVCDGDIFGIR